MGKGIRQWGLSVFRRGLDPLDVEDLSGRLGCPLIDKASGGTYSLELDFPFYIVCIFLVNDGLKCSI